MTTNKDLKPRPIFRVLFFLLGLYFLYDGYLGIVTRGLTDSFGGYFHRLFLDPGVGLFFCWRMALRGSAWWGFLPRWMMK